MHSIYYASVPKGTIVHTKDGCMLMLTAPKKWTDRTVQGVMLHGPKEHIGRYETNWCADVFRTHEPMPCDDSTL